ncbi:hypothetical protein GGR56DRAFT_646642 [Xylariaceae sp. FL0804]|nr:hypothetical protein GGR56DRAFT_646642 [Xylariaceae sp. FL0804]
MLRAISRRFSVPLVAPSVLSSPLVQQRTIRHQAYEASFDVDELTEAREWFTSFGEDSLPQGRTSYARSSGPGGQHVNKTESKAITVWPIEELSKSLPKLVRSELRTSRYYTRRNDSIAIQAQTQRSRSANAADNRTKLLEEIRRIYRERVPGSTSEKTMKKYERLEKSFNEARINAKKAHSSKKARRKGSE